MVTVRVPATTANLGPGFDTLGLALALYNTLTFEEVPEGLYFEGVEPDYATEENLAVVSYKAVLTKLGLPMPGLRLSIRADIPICRGLGSSAALIAAGAAGANANHGSPLTREELLAVCNDIEVLFFVGLWVGSEKKSQYLAEELGIVTLLFVICVYSKIITKS